MATDIKQPRREYNYGDVFLLSRKKAIVGSRSDCDTSVMFGGIGLPCLSVQQT